MRLTALTQFHENEAMNAWWRLRLGPVLTWLTPARRRTILALGGLWVSVTIPLDKLGHARKLQVPTDALGQGLVIVALFAILWLCYRTALNFAALPAQVRRRPQIILHLLFWGLLAALWTTGPDRSSWRAVLTGIAITFPFLIWRCGYMLLSGQRGRMSGTRFWDHLFYLWPVYGGTNTPYGKGLDYLSRNEAKTEEALARSQLAGLKLLLLSFLWRAAITVMDGVVYGTPGNAVFRALGGFTLGVPHLSHLVEQGGSVPLRTGWVSLYCELVWLVLTIAAEGHFIIAMLRFSGFNVFRNTYKPLLAQSIVEFWNRYYYYFKELLVEFFFLPTFARRFKQWPRLRLFAAVFAAAFLGNMYYHVILKDGLIVSGDIRGILRAFHSRAFYCLLLTAGIYVSMLREQIRAGRPPAASSLRRLVKIAGVWTFFALINIWNVKSSASFGPRSTFFLSLIGLG